MNEEIELIIKPLEDKKETIKSNLVIEKNRVKECEKLIEKYKKLKIEALANTIDLQDELEETERIIKNTLIRLDIARNGD